MLRVILRVLLLVMATAALFGQTRPATPEKAPPPASQKAPPEVDAALRTRITQFYQLEVEGRFNQALQLVAEDTKDLFVGSSKPTYQSSEIQSIRYSDDFTKAEVMVMVTRLLPIQGFMGHPVPTKTTSRWKLENGQWCYYGPTCKRGYMRRLPCPDAPSPRHEVEYAVSRETASLPRRSGPRDRERQLRYSSTSVCPDAPVPRYDVEYPMSRDATSLPR